MYAILSTDRGYQLRKFILTFATICLSMQKTSSHIFFLLYVQQATRNPTSDIGFALPSSPMLPLPVRRQGCSPRSNRAVVNHSNTRFFKRQNKMVPTGPMGRGRPSGIHCIHDNILNPYAASETGLWCFISLMHVMPLHFSMLIEQAF